MKMGSMYRAVPSALQVVTRMNEAGLMATAKRGEAAALDTLYRAHAEKLFRTVHRITRNRDDAEDAVQDSFLRAFLHLKTFDERSTFYNLAYTHWGRFGADDPSEEAGFAWTLCIWSGCRRDAVGCTGLCSKSRNAV